MAKQSIVVDSTDQTIDVFIMDATSGTGAGLTGLVYNSSGLTCYYRKGATGSATALSLATQTVGGAHSDGGFVEIDATNMPGLYRLDLSDTMVADEGTTKVYLKGATNMVPVVLEIEVVSSSGTFPANFSALQITAGGVVKADVETIKTQTVTCAAGVTVGAYVGGTGAAALEATAQTILADTNELQTDWVNGGRLDLILDACATASSLSGVETKIDTIDGIVDAILVDTAEIGAAGAGLTEAGGTGDHLTAVPWNSAWDAEVESECTDALNAYDPPTNAEMEARTLVAASYGTAANQSTIAGFIDTEIATIITHLADIKGATFSGATDSLEAIRDRGDLEWITATGFSTLDAAGVRTAVGLAAANLDSQLDAIPTAAENRAEMDSNSTKLAAILADTGTDGVVVASGSKTGYALASDGLDSISTTAPSGVASNFREMMVQLWRRFFKRTVKAGTTSGTIKTYADDGTTVATTQAFTDDGSTQDVGAAT